MKNVHILSCALLTSITAHCMEQNPSILTSTTQSPSWINTLESIIQQEKENSPLVNPPSYTWQNIDISVIAKSLDNDYRSHLTNRLIEYSKADLTPQDMEQIENMNFMMTGLKSKHVLTSYLNNEIRDEKQNNFLHIAIKKKDIPALKWLTEVVHCSAYQANSNRKEPIDLCIDQLLPGADENNKQIAHEMLDILTARYNTAGFAMYWRKSFLSKMVLLDLENTKHETLFTLKDVLLTRFLLQAPNCCPSTEKPILLSEIYQTVVDKDKNSYTHILVEKKLPDRLYEFIKKDYITFATNNDNKTPLTIAQDLFQEFTQHKDAHKVITETPNEFNRRRCCLFMLLNYIKLKKNIAFEQCCEKHTI